MYLSLSFLCMQTEWSDSLDNSSLLAIRNIDDPLFEL